MKCDEKFSLEDSYLDQVGIMSTYGKICQISFGYVDSNGQKQIRRFYGEDERYIVESFNQIPKINLNQCNKENKKINSLEWIFYL